MKFKPKSRAAVGSLEFLPHAVSEQASAANLYRCTIPDPSCFAGKIRVFAGDKAKMKDKFYGTSAGVFGEYKAGVK